MNNDNKMDVADAIADDGASQLEVIGARVHNLKNIDVTIPRNKLTVITGLSGSGKSSLAFDTIFAEGQRRYIETFSAYARNMLGTLERPDVDKISGLSPVIAIEQKTINRNPRSTIGTTTEIYDYLRLLYARIGEARSYISGEPMVKYTR
jgi:excinuclease ABC subunit A